MDCTLGEDMHAADPQADAPHPACLMIGPEISRGILKNTHLNSEARSRGQRTRPPATSASGQQGAGRWPDDSRRVRPQTSIAARVCCSLGRPDTMGSCQLALLQRCQIYQKSLKQSFLGSSAERLGKTRRASWLWDGECGHSTRLQVRSRRVSAPASPVLLYRSTCA